MQRQGLESTYLSIYNELNKVLKLWHTDKTLLLYRCGYSQLIFNKMDAILLKKKPESIMLDSDLVVFDEIIQGILTSEWFLPVFTGCDKGMRIITLSYLIDNYLFPEKEGQMKARFLHFLKGANPKLIETIGFYESDELEIESV